MSMPTLKIKPGHAKPLYAGHPWVFASAIERVPEALAPGAEVRIVDHKDKFLGRGFVSPDSAIAVRILRYEDLPIDDHYLHVRLQAALRFRLDTLRLDRNGAADEVRTTDTYRLIHSEGDGLGGLCVDVYKDCLSVQFGTIGMYHRRSAICEALRTLLHPSAIIDRSDPATCRKENIPEHATIQTLWGEIPEQVEVSEHGHRFEVPFERQSSQKTGLYLDQRENRARFARFAAGKRVLDLCCYHGAFSVYAGRAEAASLTLVDSSHKALEIAAINLKRNGIEGARLLQGNWADSLKALKTEEAQFDLIVVDPPKFARNRSELKRALEGYRELNEKALRLLAPGGILFTCSCSGNVSELEFERAVAAALRRAQRRGRIVERTGAAPDHPIAPGFEHGGYLKCLTLFVD